MNEKTKYEYDSEVEVLIRLKSGELPQIMRKRYPVWRHFGPEDESYSRAIYLGQGCWERLDTISEQKAQAVLNKWGCSPENMTLLEKLDRTALDEAKANCGMYLWNNAKITPETLRQSDAAKNMVIRNLGEIGLAAIHADVMNRRIIVRLSPAVRSVLACTIFDIHERLVPYETLAKLMKKGMWTLELQRPFAYENSMLEWEYLIERMHSWLYVRETAADETNTYGAEARDPQQAPGQKKAESVDHYGAFLQEMKEHEAFRKIFENAKTEYEIMRQTGRVLDSFNEDRFADGQWQRFSDAEKLKKIILLYIHISRLLKSKNPPKKAAEEIPNSEAIRFLFDAWRSRWYDDRGKKGTVLQMIDAGEATDIKQFAAALTILHSCCPDWACVITKPRLICVGYPSKPSVKTTQKPEPTEEPEPHEAFLLEMQQYAAFQQVFETAKAEFADLLQMGRLPETIANKPQCVAQWYCFSEIEKLAYIYVLTELLFPKALAGLAEAEIHVSTTKNIPNCLAISLFYLIWCRKMDRLRVCDEGDSSEMIELARALNKLHSCYPKWLFSFGASGRHANDERTDAPRSAQAGAPPNMPGDSAPTLFSAREASEQRESEKIRLIFPDTNRSVTLEPGSYEIGRDSACTICPNWIDSKAFLKISRRHALLFFDRHRWYIRDLGSRNGTWLNTDRLEPNNDVPLKAGDIITLSLRFSMILTPPEGVSPNYIICRD